MRRSQCGSNLCRMVRIVIYDSDVSKMSLDLKTSFCSAEALKPPDDNGVVKSCLQRKCDSCHGILDIVASGYVEHDMKSMSGSVCLERGAAFFVIADVGCVVSFISAQAIGYYFTCQTFCDLVRIFDCAV